MSRYGCCLNNSCDLFKFCPIGNKRKEQGECDIKLERGFCYGELKDENYK